MENLENIINKSIRMWNGVPIDDRYIANSLDSLNEDIHFPYVGLIFYTKQEGKYYKVLSCKDGYRVGPNGPMSPDYIEGAYIIPNYYIDQFDELIPEIPPQRTINAEKDQVLVGDGNNWTTGCELRAFRKDIHPAYNAYPYNDDSQNIKYVEYKLGVKENENYAGYPSQFCITNIMQNMSDKSYEECREGYKFILEGKSKFIHGGKATTHISGFNDIRIFNSSIEIDDGNRGRKKGQTDPESPPAYGSNTDSGDSTKIRIRTAHVELEGNYGGKTGSVVENTNIDYSIYLPVTSSDVQPTPNKLICHPDSFVKYHHCYKGGNDLILDENPTAFLKSIGEKGDYGYSGTVTRTSTSYKGQTIECWCLTKNKDLSDCAKKTFNRNTSQSDMPVIHNTYYFGTDSNPDGPLLLMHGSSQIVMEWSTLLQMEEYAAFRMMSYSDFYLEDYAALWMEGYAGLKMKQASSLMMDSSACIKMESANNPVSGMIYHGGHVFKIGPEPSRGGYTILTPAKTWDQCAHQDGVSDKQKRNMHNRDIDNTRIGSCTNGQIAYIARVEQKLLEQYKYYNKENGIPQNLITKAQAYKAHSIANGINFYTDHPDYDTNKEYVSSRLHEATVIDGVQYYTVEDPPLQHSSPTMVLEGDCTFWMQSCGDTNSGGTGASLFHMQPGAGQYTKFMMYGSSFTHHTGNAHEEMHDDSIFIMRGSNNNLPWKDYWMPSGVTEGDEGNSVFSKWARPNVPTNNSPAVMFYNGSILNMIGDYRPASFTGYTYGRTLYITNSTSNLNVGDSIEGNLSAADLTKLNNELQLRISYYSNVAYLSGGVVKEKKGTTIVVKDVMYTFDYQTDYNNALTNGWSPYLTKQNNSPILEVTENSEVRFHEDFSIVANNTGITISNGTDTIDFSFAELQALKALVNTNNT